MKNIRQATEKDLSRIAEIEIFNYRLNFYPIFKSDWFYCEYLTVPSLMEKYAVETGSFYVYDDGVIKGFVKTSDNETPMGCSKSNAKREIYSNTSLL